MYYVPDGTKNADIMNVKNAGIRVPLITDDGEDSMSRL